MIAIRKANQRGQTQEAWLKSYHTFSFANYYDPDFMGFGNLRVINEDTVQPAFGFGAHSHADMEIITYVIKGKIQHKDSMGSEFILQPGEIQCMSAGRGVVHSEINPSSEEVLHFLQIWVLPREHGTKPAYAQRTIVKTPDQLNLIGSGDIGKDVVFINQDINLYASYLRKGSTINYSFAANHIGWLQMVKGQIQINNRALRAGDGAAIYNENQIIIECDDAAEFLLFDLKNQS